MDPAIRDKAHRLTLLKAKAAAVGNLRAVKHYDALLKKFLLENSVIYSPSVASVLPSAGTQGDMLQRQAEGERLVRKHNVPDWFRPGYTGQIRTSLWIRLSDRYKKGLAKQHALGKLPVYYPAPSYWARKIKPSDFHMKTPPAMIMSEVVEEDPTLLQEVEPEKVVAVVEAAEDQVMDVADSVAIVQAEAEDEDALIATLEQPGEGKLKAEAPWYDDKNKVFLAAVAALIAVAVVK